MPSSHSKIGLPTLLVAHLGGLSRAPPEIAVGRRSIPIGDIGITAFGDARSAAERVRCQGYRVRGSDIDLLGDLDGVIDLDAEISNGGFDLRMSQRLGFILRISFLIENQRRAARRSVLAAAERSSSR